MPPPGTDLTDTARQVLIQYRSDLPEAPMPEFLETTQVIEALKQKRRPAEIGARIILLV